MKKQVDLVSGKILEPLIKLSLPILGTSFIQMAYNMTVNGCERVPLCVCVCVHVYGHGHTHRRDSEGPGVAFWSYCANSLRNHKKGVQCFLEAPSFHGKSIDSVWNQVDKTTNL